MNEDVKKYFLETNSTYYNKLKPRQKVFETILELIENNKNLENTIDLAEYFIKKEEGKLIADICIKSQYGSKREFYVINIGAKALARCMENFYKKVSEQNIHEAISIPGDKKMMAMQNMLDRIYSTKQITTTSKIMYVNGDCTKWSAAETMASFIAMNLAFKTHISEKMYNLLLSTFNVWSNKEIQVPTEIINNVIKPRIDNKNQFNFMTDTLIKNNGRIKSTQNFFTRYV